MNPSQLALWGSTASNVLLCGGFGSGKTTGGAYKTIQLKALNPSVPGLLLSQTSRSLWAITLRRLFAVCRAAGLPVPRVMDKQYECYLDWGDGVPVYLRGAHSPASYDGLDVGWVVGDEIRHWSKEAYDVAIGRRRVPCALPQAAFTSTPELGWMSDEFNSGNPERPVIVAPTLENLHNLSPEYIDNLRISYSRGMQRAVLEGQFAILEGAVFPQLEVGEGSPWITDYDATKGAGQKTYLAIDPGYRHSAWIWVREVAPLKWVVFDQLMPDGRSDHDCVADVNARGWPIDEIWVDPAADATQSAFNLDTIDMLRGIKARNKSPIRYVTGVFRSIAYGIDKMRVLLGDPPMHPIRLTFSRALAKAEQGKSRGILRDLSFLKYPDTRDGVSVCDKPLKDGRTDHSTDALRNLVVGLFLTNDPLRSRDPAITETKSAGYKVAA